MSLQLRHEKEPIWRGFGTRQRAESEQAPSVRGKFVIYIPWMLFFNDNNDMSKVFLVILLFEMKILLLYSTLQMCKRSWPGINHELIPGHEFLNSQDVDHEQELQSQLHKSVVYVNVYLLFEILNVFFLNWMDIHLY